MKLVPRFRGGDFYYNYSFLIMPSGVSSTRVPFVNWLLSVSTYWMSPPASILMARRTRRPDELLGTPTGGSGRVVAVVPATCPEAPVAVPPLTEEIGPGAITTFCTTP